MNDHPAPRWRKASASASNGSCVELADLGGGLLGVRDSKLGDSSPVLRFARSEVRAWLAGVKGGEFDDLA
jgi:hypothetical protein